LSTRANAAQVFPWSPPCHIFRHVVEADRQAGREIWTDANRAAVLFCAGTPKTRSPALPFHISSRANASQDRDQSFQADSLRRPALARLGFARDDELVLPCVFFLPAALGGLKLLRLTTVLSHWKSDDPSAWLFFL
jgi:hypothetical protein